MANYGYIHVKPRKLQDFEVDLRAAVGGALGVPWEVWLTPWADNGPVWFVFLPGTAPKIAADARRMGLAPGEDVGFPVARQGSRIAFRHPFNSFAHWAQGRVEEALAEFYQARIVYDATGRAVRPGVKEYTVGKTYQDFLRRNFPVLTEEDIAFFERYFRYQVPEGHWFPWV